MVDAHIQRERQAGRLLGPLPHSLLPLCQVSPIGLVPKSQPGQWRLIVDLSFPEGHSINDGIAQDVSSIQYARLEDAVQMVRVLGWGTLLAKVDLKSGPSLLFNGKGKHIWTQPSHLAFDQPPNYSQQ